MERTNTAEKHVNHGFSQIKLTNWLLNNLQQFKLKPTTKLVLLYLSGCYNPKHADVFPKQKTIALQMGISERSVISAIQELHEQGLVISERKYTNRYRFTARILNQGVQNESFLQPEEIAEAKCKDCTLQSEKSALPYIEQEKKQEKEQTGVNKINYPKKSDNSNEGGNVYYFQSTEDLILEEYAAKHGARNVKAYVNTLKSSGSAAKIISEYKKQEKVTQRALRCVQETQELIRNYNELSVNTSSPYESEAWKNLGIMFGIKKPIS